MTFTTRSVVAVLALSVCLWGVVHGGTYTLPTPENPAHPGMCFERQRKQAVAVGASITDHSSCTRLTCFKSNDQPPTYTMQGATCGYVKRLPANCHEVPGNPSADYPDCCSDVKCDGEPEGDLTIVG